MATVTPAQAEAAGYAFVRKWYALSRNAKTPGPIGKTQTQVFTALEGQGSAVRQIGLSALSLKTAKVDQAAADLAQTDPVGAPKAERFLGALAARASGLSPVELAEATGEGLQQAGAVAYKAIGGGLLLYGAILAGVWAWFTFGRKGGA